MSELSVFCVMSLIIWVAKAWAAHYEAHGGGTHDDEGEP